MNPSQPRTVSQEAAEEAEQLPASLKLGAVALTPPLDDERPVAPVCDWRIDLQRAIRTSRIASQSA